MQNPFQDNLRKLWLLLCTSLLLVYSIVPGETGTLFFDGAAGSFLEVLMFLLSFPLGTAAFLFHSPDLGVTGRFAFWAAAMGLSYAQWFHLLPALLRRLPARPAASVTLNLSPAASVAPRPAFSAAETRPLRRLDAARPPVPQFNERGQTPLERVFRDGE